MRVVVDDRERGGGVILALRAMPDMGVKVRRLPLGDYLLDDRILFERKTVPDFAVSLLDGRLFRQACRLSGAAYRPVYVLEGVWNRGTVKGVSREGLLGAVTMLSVTLSIPLLRSRDPQETAQLIRYAGEQARRVLHNAVHRPGYRPRGLRKRRLFVLQGLPGIGPARAARLLDTFGSLEGIFGADADELAEVEGLGWKTADAIRRLVGDDASPADATGGR